jgi:membrane protease subunit HflK
MQKVKTSKSRTMPVGFTLIEEVTGTGRKASTREWLTGDTNIVKMEATLYYSVSDPIQYLYGVSDLADGLPHDMVIRKAAETVITDLVASMGIDEVLSTGKIQLRDQVLPRTQAMLDQFHMGVALTQFNLREVAPPPEVQDDFNEVTSAKSFRAQKLSEAEGARRTAMPYARSKANKVLQDAESYRTETIAFAEGAAAGFLKLAATMKTNRNVNLQRLWLESVESILANRSTMILPRVPAGQSQPVYVELD